MRILLDTNIFVSGLIGRAGPPAELLRLWLDGRFILVTSRYQIDELRRVLQYERLRPRITPEQAGAILDTIASRSIIVADLPAVALSPDPYDNPILATAIAGHADLIVSGDKGHLIVLGSAEGIPIVLPRDALQRVQE